MIGDMIYSKLEKEVMWKLAEAGVPIAKCEDLAKSILGTTFDAVMELKKSK